MTSPSAQLVSCVMATGGRAEWVAQSLLYFRRQDHPARELVIVDDGDDDLRALLGPAIDDPRITYVRMAEPASIGAKRNLGCELARGEFVAHWDDDDWYGPARLGAQLAPLLDGSADLTALRDAIWFDVDQWRFRRPSRGLHTELFFEDVHCGTLVYRRSIWERGVRYPDASLAEDASFLRSATRTRSRLAAAVAALPAAGRYLYVRHGSNSWQLDGRFAYRADWEDVGEPDALGADRAFYASRSSAAPAHPTLHRSRP